ncbi:hypothetical protein PoB_007515100 [Plakobranchus ocellatus]|uniref:Uncharacterized protein n=1 Tax=Plakobranchus ocellatus TaxID=259542 RepID=A0AAV4DXT3_9GAST|nr:hypothetical protein PoB_007515100 [Plakobranchus ocellatus]
MFPKFRRDPLRRRLPPRARRSIQEITQLIREEAIKKIGVKMDSQLEMFGEMGENAVAIGCVNVKIRAVQLQALQSLVVQPVQHRCFPGRLQF